VAAAETVPIALLTQKCDEIQRLHYLSSGVAHVIERPVTKKALAATVASLGSPLVLQAA
jgi:DNA-binding response OmpR family regulator